MTPTVYNNLDEVFIQMYEKGYFLSKRGVKCKCLFNPIIVLKPGVIKTYKSRPLSIQYLIDELNWYLNPNEENTERIKKYKIWKEYFDGGKIFSNYGEKALKQLPNVIKELQNDMFTTRAIIYYGSIENLGIIQNGESIDMVCTIAMQFYFTLDNFLNATIYMRSNDLIFGFFYDFIWASLLFEKVLKNFPKAKTGNLTWIVTNLHVYEKDFKKLEEIYFEIKGGLK